MRSSAVLVSSLLLLATACAEAAVSSPPPPPPGGGSGGSAGSGAGGAGGAGQGGAGGPGGGGAGGFAGAGGSGGSGGVPGGEGCPDGCGCIVQVSSSWHHAVVIHPDGSLWAWGRNDGGELGVSSAELNVLLPTRMVAPAGARFVDVATGGRSTVAVRDDGTLWVQGGNGSGQLGLGDTVPRLMFEQLGSDGDWDRVWSGINFVFARKLDGRLFAFGNNSFGQLGVGDLARHQTPTEVLLPSPPVKVEGRSHHALALLQDGTVHGWGAMGCGELGEAEPAGCTDPPAAGIALRTAPAPIPGLTGCTDIAAGYLHSAAICGGRLLTFGRNVEGQLGHGALDDDPIAHPVPEEVTPFGSPFVRVFAGLRSTHALREDGGLFAFGSHGYGQLGVGPNLSGLSLPSPMSVEGSWSSVAGGAFHSVLLTSDGVAWSAGNNDRGQLGIDEPWQSVQHRGAPQKVRSCPAP